MARDSNFNILGKIGIDRCRRVLGQQRYALRDRAARRPNSKDHRYRLRVVLDDDFRASSAAKSLAASVSEMWNTCLAMTRLYTTTTTPPPCVSQSLVVRPLRLLH